MFYKFIVRAATTVVRYQFRPLVATKIFSNNHLQIHNLLAFQNEGISILNEDDEEVVCDLTIKSCCQQILKEARIQ